MVCDTGSSDETASIAAEAGAVVVRFPWVDDFADARNASIAAATGDFVLVIDADERLAPGGLALLRRVALRGDVDACFLGLHNASDPEADVRAVLSGEARLGQPLLVPRFFRKTGDLRYQGRVHEDVSAWMSARRDRVAVLDDALIHLGAAPSLRRMLAKDSRNQHLLHLAVSDAPDDAFRLGLLARARLVDGEVDQAEALADHAWTLVASAIAEGRAVPAFGWIAGVRALAHLYRGDLDGAMEIVAEAKAQGSALPDLDLIAAQALTQRVPIAETGERAYEAATLAEVFAGEARAASTRRHLEEPSPGATGGVAAAAVVIARLAAGRTEAAQSGLADPTLASLDPVDVALLHAELAILRGDTDAASAACADLPDSVPDAWVMRAACAALSSNDPLTAAAAEAATRFEREGWRSLHRAAWVPALRAASSGDLAPIFVVGAGRSGTTLLRAMLDAHPHIAIGPENHLIQGLCAHRDHQWASLAPALGAGGVSEGLLDRSYRAAVHALMSGLGGGKPRVGDKSPENSRHIGLLARWFPRARFIHIVRDGRDVVASLLRQSWRFADTGEPMPICQSPEAAATYWRDTVARARCGLARAPGRAITVRYEELVHDPEGQLRRVLDFLGEPFDAAVLRPAGPGARLPGHESSSAAVAEPIQVGAIGRWRHELDDPGIQAVDAVCGSLLAELGYANQPSTLFSRSETCVG